MEHLSAEQLVNYYRTTLIHMLENHSQFACHTVKMLLDNKQIEPHFNEDDLLNLMKQNIIMRYPYYMNATFKEIPISVYKKLTICLNTIFYILKSVRIDLNKIFLIQKYNKDVQILGLFSSTNVMDDAFFIETQDFKQIIKEILAGFYDKFFFPTMEKNPDSHIKD